MKRLVEMKLKDFKEKRYLLLTDDFGTLYVQPFDKNIQKTQMNSATEFNFYAGYLIIDNLPKEYFTRFFIKIRGREYFGGIDYEKERLELIELNRAIDLFLKIGFKPIDFNVEKLKNLIEERIIKVTENIKNYGKDIKNPLFKMYYFNSLAVDMHHKDNMFWFKKENVFLGIMNDYGNTFRIFKKEIYPDKVVKYNGKTIFHHKLLV